MSILIKLKAKVESVNGKNYIDCTKNLHDVPFLTLVSF